MAIDKMNEHYSFTNPASIYDEEALTALELAGRTASKVNEAVGAFNELERDTNEHLTTQDKNIQNMNDVVMPEKVRAEVQRKIDDGTFTEAIDASMGGLNARVDNLLGKVSEGTTTMDAEVIDARTAIGGYASPTLGDAMRGNEKLSLISLNVNDFVTEQVDGERVDGFYYKNGTFQALADYETLSINVNPYDVYFIRASYGWDAPDALVFDSNNNLIHAYHMNPTGGARNEYEEPIVIPSNGAVLKICSYKASCLPTALKVTGRAFTSDLLNEVSQNMLDMVTTLGTPKDGDPLDGVIRAESYLPNQLTIETVVNSAEKYFVGVYQVTCGDWLHMKGSANWGNYVYTFFNGDKIVSSLRAVNRVTLDKCIVVPNGATTLYLACEDGVAPEVYKVAGVGERPNMWGHLTWCCLGDSLTEINTRASKRYHDYVREKTGIVVKNQGISGTGYMNNAGSDKAFWQRVGNLPTCDVITIFGSGNDLGYIDSLGSVTDTGTDTLCGCVNKTIDNIYATMPTVQLGIVSPSPWTGQTPDDPTCAMYRYTEALKGICKRRGIPFLDLFRLSTFRPNDANYRALVFSKDPEGVANHPDENGHKILAPHFYKFLDGLIGTY